MGALARSRTLHELAVTSIVLSEFGKREEHADLAERLLQHQDVIDWSDAETYQQHCGVLGLEPFADTEMAELREARNALIQRYGTNYKQSYGWAEQVAGKSRPTFKDLAELAGIDHLRSYYQWANHEVHADAKGSVLNVLEWRGMRFMNTAYTGIGLADPGQIALISLYQCTTSLMLSVDDPGIEALLALKALGHLLDEACDALADCEAAMEKLERRPDRRLRLRRRGPDAP